jgi:hypothetical protein
MPQALKQWYVSAAIAAFLAAHAPASHSGERDIRLVPVSRAHLCVTKGAIEEADGSRLEVKVPEMRAVVAHPTQQVAEAKLTYLGPTSKDKPLGSGEIRRQFGLKLRAQNGCNLVYAMWRIEPKSELVVSVKRNPGMSTHAQCGTNGYHNIKPTRDLAAPRLNEGENHILRAEMEETRMRVFIDGKLTWEGYLDRDVLSFDGPVGVRTDNGRFKFELLAGERTGHGETAPCHAGDEDE